MYKNYLKENKLKAVIILYLLYYIYLKKIISLNVFFFLNSEFKKKIFKKKFIDYNKQIYKIIRIYIKIYFKLFNAKKRKFIQKKTFFLLFFHII